MECGVSTSAPYVPSVLKFLVAVYGYVSSVITDVSEVPDT